jgi:hypothetical protein
MDFFRKKYRGAKHEQCESDGNGDPFLLRYGNKFWGKKDRNGQRGFAAVADKAKFALILLIFGQVICGILAFCVILQRICHFANAVKIPNYVNGKIWRYCSCTLQRNA